MRTGLMIVAAAALLVLANSLFMVREYESGALFRLGAITRADIPPGLHMKIPFIESVRCSTAACSPGRDARALPDLGKEGRQCRLLRALADPGRGPLLRPPPASRTMRWRG